MTSLVTHHSVAGAPSVLAAALAMKVMGAAHPRVDPPRETVGSPVPALPDGMRRWERIGWGEVLHLTWREDPDA